MREAQPVDGAVEAHQGRRMEISDDGVILDALAHGVILACRSARDAWAGADGSTMMLRFLHPSEDTGRREGVADVLVDGGTGEDDTDDLASGAEQRTA